MKTFSGIILRIFGWKIIGDLPNFDKSVLIFAPHTSYWDGFYGKLFLMQFDVNYKFLSKKEFFRFPLNLFFIFFGSIPVSKNKEFINEIIELFNSSKNLHIVLSPEGHLAKTDHWKKGFYYMAKGANVPIVVGYIDYKKKEMGVKSVIKDSSDINKTFKQISTLYKNVNAKYPDKFTLDKRYS